LHKNTLLEKGPKMNFFLRFSQEVLRKVQNFRISRHFAYLLFTNSDAKFRQPKFAAKHKENRTGRKIQYLPGRPVTEQKHAQGSPARH